MPDRLTITAPDDFHCHLREGALLQSVILHTAQNFRRAIVMPNLKKPVTTHKDALSYRQMIEESLQKAGFLGEFTPLMTLYLTDETDEQDLKQAYLAGDVTAVKLYPAHATTNSSHGVTDISKLDKTFKTMSEIGMPLLMHGEVTDKDIDIFDREAVFIDRILKGMRKRFPDLKMVLEHITTEQAVDFVGSHEGEIAATITPHHMVINRNALFQGGMRPHHYCLPIAKRERHRQAVHDAALSGNKSFFAGTDSAPHRITEKEQDCGCAGIFNSFEAPAFYAELFEKGDKLAHLEGFLSHHGADFYGLPRNHEKVTLVKDKITIPYEIKVDDDVNDIMTANEANIRPFMAGQDMAWQVLKN